VNKLTMNCQGIDMVVNNAKQLDAIPTQLADNHRRLDNLSANVSQMKVSENLDTLTTARIL
jgi:hypothetical protein